ncbi:PVC-type heme-binding CxxCH protein [Aureliella helgolandensis]|uniref:PVC-type heme-binding CxxCH protein n=1 Tax=Aureliella helgolandensis TaxID=2527968 RepID=UPI001E37CAF0|nr:PVC-type heme-binding CxxCH protein [Aureliella helgolandensis]
MQSLLPVALALWGAVLGGGWGHAQEGKVLIPRKQTSPPGPPLSPQESLAKMVVPPGFHVELVASEPALLNPVAMAFDERGRIWVTESFEYPRHEPGPGRDRIKILEDTTGDGKIDSVKIFADGLNIPSGIAVGHGGVWVANAPDLLFLQDTDGDDKADKQEVVVTGFGRADTHELPNSLTWGPDGCLYGLNGVFNPCRVEANGKVHEFTCAMFRIDPKTREFSLFCEGTSNPWGIAFDPWGEAFISACVIDHLWHLTETGYYHRQGGPYPPHTWKLESIVKHKHQMAAYCGITYFDSPAFPAEYRNKLLMGNIHGNCLNVDRVEQRGATYAGFGEDDFLSGNDVWFMPVAQKVGPDGCLYVLDWYDRYHCYQDASADPEGVDRGHGRLYRVVHTATGRPAVVSLAEASSEELVRRLADPNIFLRETAQRLLAERNCEGVVDKLEAIALGTQAAPQRLSAVWALQAGKQIRSAFLAQLLEEEDEHLRSWGVRIAGDQFAGDSKVQQLTLGLLEGASPKVQLQLAIALGKYTGMDPIAHWVQLAAECGSDPIIPSIIWQNLHPKLDGEAAANLLTAVEQLDLENAPGLAELLTKVAEKLQF